MRFEHPTICFETKNKNGYPQNMFINPTYTWSNRLQAGVKLWFFVAYYWCQFRCYNHVD